ncbi:hypothetical protein CcaverHIS002_0207980 [Cutaneotrichosporon cavernicola]|uniref:Ribosome maturation protein SDO1/SBDS N-terminal domain-containing protein n=1 Tax=Cutaneotrichosporon cavernicola TaxID=279322 RepID=A0AA48L1D2_9TREE|nr:uncharacterized protein CcaverHIS019_0207970 [Cutaneotrichosporon cavernicola]BEI81638.1 hypothetical protein CcaverHIS002_0207980 [Cutaneotrichosporon cavernicola]BEI89435.1 hypothetical protein CcaverHIS019_0207970 [Cutaneotrichosporon cavernicola]BEI97209.1 hypothetical protein CcaverHIS631_0207980 [Cutaneotrichosporon cavernicola]BEJ04983.1 hypothetical protein CcaverHIS641_0208000 [Cutaneotrichosporon cavernicola]
MSNEVLTIIWRPHEHAEEYLIFVDDEKEFKEWREQPEGGKSIALSRFIGNFSVYKSNTGGVTGVLQPISRMELETAFFGDDKKVKDKSVEAVIQLILQNGREQKQQFKANERSDFNTSRGAAGDNHPGTQRR